MFQLSEKNKTHKTILLILFKYSGVQNNFLILPNKGRQAVKSAVIDDKSDRQAHGSKPTCSILLCSRETRFTALFFAWQSWQGVLTFGLISFPKPKIKNFNWVS